MCNPWTFSLLNRQLTSGLQMDAMNLGMNQCFADSMARSSLYTMPTMNWGSFCNYGNLSNNSDFSSIMQYTINQWQWQQNNNCMGWNNFGGMNWGNCGGMNWNNPWGLNLGNTPSTPSTPAKTPEERTMMAKYNKLVALTKQLSNPNNKMKFANKEALYDAATHPNGKTYQEKFDNLYAEYKKVGKSVVKKFLASNNSIGLSIKGKESTSESFYNELASVGYEFANSAVDSKINNLLTTLSSIEDNQENYMSDDILANLNAGSGYDILDVISSWNTQMKGSNGNERVIKLIAKKYDSLTNDSTKNVVKTQVLAPFVNELINKANGLKDELDAASKVGMEDAISALQTEFSKAGLSNSLSDKFDTLYILCRKAAIAQLRSDINNTYSDIDSDLFNDDLFEDDTTEDLVSEGFDSTRVDKVKVGHLNNDESDVNDPQAELNAVKDLIANEDILKKESQQVTIDGKKCDVYKETTGEKRSFVLVDGQLYEYNNGKKGDKVNASGIEAAYNTAKDISDNYNLSDTNIASAKDSGAKIWDKLSGYTTNDDWKTIDKELESINATNVLYMLAGTNHASGFFSQLFTEATGRGRRETISKQIGDAIVEYIEDNMSELDEKDKEEVKEILKDFKDYDYSKSYGDYKNNGEMLGKKVQRLIEIFKIANTSQPIGNPYITPYDVWGHPIASY